MIENEILRVVNGSKLYGLDHPGSDDDYIAVFVEKPERVFSPANPQKAVPLHDRGPQERNSGGDIDGQAYSLRNFLKLALAGNPTIVSTLFVPADKVVYADKWGELLLSARDRFVSQLAFPRFYGYMRKQMERLDGSRSDHIPNRPTFHEMYGYDTKYAMHIARLAMQGTELARTGVITLPMPADERELCMDIRMGKYTKEEALGILGYLSDVLNSSEENSPLRPEPDYEVAHKLSRLIHEDIWRQNEPILDLNALNRP